MKNLASLSVKYHDSFQECGKFTYMVHSRHLRHGNPCMCNVTVHCLKMFSSKFQCLSYKNRFISGFISILPSLFLYGVNSSLPRIIIFKVSLFELAFQGVFEEAEADRNPEDGLALDS